MNDTEKLREEILIRIESSRKYDWIGGFEPEFLADFCISKLLQREKDLVGEIEKMRKLPTEDQEHGLEYDEGYDSALDDLLSTINNKDK